MVIVASARITAFAAANAERHPDSHRARIEDLIRTIRVIRAFKSKGAKRLRSVSVGDVREDLKRRDSMRIEQPRAQKGAVEKLWARIRHMACFRGFHAYLIMAVSQWYLAAAIDFFLSGQPSDFKLGYGSTSIVLATLFGSGFAIWTHYTITKPSSKNLFNISRHFPKGEAVLIELWPITAVTAICEHLTLSCPLALSRSFELKRYAFDMDSWNTLDEAGQRRKVMEFAAVFLLYIVLVACLAVPAKMVLRRVHASMLSDDDLAIVPFHRGQRKVQPYDMRSKIQRPGLTVSQAFGTITLRAYLDVLLVHAQYFALNQFIQMAYWSSNWKLHQWLEVDKYAPTNLPCSPVGRVLPYAARNISIGSIPSTLYHNEL